MCIQSVALVFDDQPRPDTTGVHCLRALSGLARAIAFHPDRRNEIPATGFDLYLSVDDDSDHRLPDRLRPQAYWAIDTHRDFDARLDRARRADLVLAAQRDGAERLRAAGVGSATWLPLACDPGVHRKHDVPKRYDVAFVGNPVPGPRMGLLGLIRGRFPASFVGNAYGDAMAEAYSAARVAFNRSLADDVNMRVFEAAACGSMLLTNDLAHNGQEELFRSGEHVATYRDADEMLDKIAYYLKHDRERERIAAAGRAEALARHTYRHRMETLLMHAEKTLGKASVGGFPAAPRRTIPRAALRPADRSGAAAAPGLASVIVPCCNQLAFTRQCVAALMRHTRRPWELIAIDNGSDDGTGPYLEGVRDAAPVPVAIVSNPANRGFPAAINQGLESARGEYIVLLNNDAVVTDGWLDQLIALTAADPTIGLTGPMSNYASPPQLVEGVPYRDMDGMHEFARRWRDERRGRWSTVGKLSGFCLLMKRAVYEAVGGLDERFGLGFFDDDDLAERARRAGFQLAAAHDLFVHHFGSRTFAASGIDAEALLDENHRRFLAKWGFPEPEGRKAWLSPWVGGDAVAIDPAAAGPRRVRVSLTMIVRNEEANLAACLDSAEGLFDEVVVVDTGSTDRTIEIARARGARVSEFHWVDDFAAARNSALARATGDYAFWLDADDVLDPPQRDALRRLLDGLRPGDPAAYVVRCACDPDWNGGGGSTVVDHIRLFPLREDVRWAYRVHEQILPALRRAGVPVRWTDVTVRHTGYTDPALRARKLLRDEAILREELAERPDDPFVLFNLGSIAVERGDWAAALDQLGRSLAGSAPTDSITRKLFALIARCRQMLGDLPAAAAACDEGLGLDPDDAELLFRKAIALRGLARDAEAESCWRRVLTLRRPERFSSLDQGIYGHLTRRNLAVLAEARGDRAEAAAQWRAVLAECPADVDAAFALHRIDGPVAPEHVPWLVPGSRRAVVPATGPGDFDPYLRVAADLVVALRARVVVELGVRLGSSALALLEGVRETDGVVWGVDLEDGHGIDDPRFRFIRGDAADCAGRWEAIDLLHVDTDPHTEEQTRRWLGLYAGRCRAIALHDAHHPAFGVGRAVRAFLDSEPGRWRVDEYWGNPSGWTVLTRAEEADHA